METMKIINLLNEKEMDSILIKAMEERALIDSTYVRGIGKTKGLIEFAKKFKLLVVVNTETIAKILREKYKFEYIYGQDNMELRKSQIVLVDDSVDINKLLKDMDCYIITGFTTRNNNINEEKIDVTLNDKIVKSLKEDIESLLNKLKVSINNGNDSNYKMLISNLKGTVELIKELDWTLKYSEYKTEVANGVFQKEIAIWEQNGDCNIRNHKVWKVENACCDGSTKKEYDILNPVDNAVLAIKYLKEKGLTENELDKIAERFGGLQNKSSVKALLDNIDK